MIHHSIDDDPRFNIIYAPDADTVWHFNVLYPKLVRAIRGRWEYHEVTVVVLVVRERDETLVLGS